MKQTNSLLFVLLVHVVIQSKYLSSGWKLFPTTAAIQTIEDGICVYKLLPRFPVLPARNSQDQTCY